MIRTSAGSSANDDSSDGDRDSRPAAYSKPFLCARATPPACVSLETAPRAALRSAAVRKRIEALGGYDLTDAGATERC